VRPGAGLSCQKKKEKGDIEVFSFGFFSAAGGGEGIFGALKTRLNGKFRNLRLSCVPKEALVFVVSYVVWVFLNIFVCFLVFTL